MKSSTILGLVLVLVVAIGVALYLPSNPDDNELIPNNINEQGLEDQSEQSDEENNGMQDEVNGNAAEDSDMAMSATVALTGSGFSPRTVTIPRGGVVTWTNEGSGPMWVASAVHPSHAVYGDTTRSEHCASGYTGPVPFDQCDNGSSYSFTFEQSGTWQYHNHLDASQTGTVIVE